MALVIFVHNLLGVLCWVMKDQLNKEILLQQLMAELKQAISVLSPSSLSCGFALLHATNRTYCKLIYEIVIWSLALADH